MISVLMRKADVMELLWLLTGVGYACRTGSSCGMWIGNIAGLHIFDGTVDISRYNCAGFVDTPRILGIFSALDLAATTSH
jgi:hypothetical protein